MNILWLASWYPSEADPYNGDFIQRQAQALARFHPLTVIHTVKDDRHLFETYPHTDIRVKGNLTEIIVYYRPNFGAVGLLNRMNSTLLYRKYFRETIQRWLRDRGRPDIVHLHVPYKAGLVALWMKRHLSLPYLLTEHWAGYVPENPDSYFKRPMAFRKLLDKIFRSADTVIPLSVNMDKTLRQLFQLQETRIIPNVVNIELFNWEDSQPKSKTRFIHVSSMVYQKNVDGLLRALAKLWELEKNWEMVMVGPAPHELRSMAESLGLGDVVQWAGEVPYEQVALEMGKSHALVMFSRFENQPCVILEALCSGLPVVSTAVGGIPEMIGNENGILIENGDEDALATGLQQLVKGEMKFNPAAIAEDAKNKFSYAVVGQQLADCYEEFLVTRN